STPDTILKTHPAMCHPGGSKVLRWLTKFSWPWATEISPWHTKTGLFLGFWADAA
ncbi:unnamed protein product, partial [Musa textilis]